MGLTRLEPVLSFGTLAILGACARGRNVAADAAPATEPIAPESVNAASASTLSRAPSPSAAQSAPSAQATAPASVVPAPRKATRPRTESDCKACNGAWGTHGISNTASCNCRTSDAGKRCRDGLECEGQCTVAETPERDVTQAGPPPRGFWVGKCSEFVAVFGCYRPIEDGAGAQPIGLVDPPQTLCAD